MSGTSIIAQISMSLTKLHLYFMIIYHCMKYESNIPMFSKYIAWKRFTYIRTNKRDIRTRVRYKRRGHARIRGHDSQAASAKETLNSSHDGHQ